MIIVVVLPFFSPTDFQWKQSVRYKTGQVLRTTEIEKKMKTIVHGDMEPLNTKRCVWKYVIMKDPEYTPGLLTDLRSASVNNSCFAHVVVKAGLHKHILHSSPELHQKDGLLPWEFQAVIFRSITWLGSWHWSTQGAPSTVFFLSSWLLSYIAFFELFCYHFLLNHPSLSCQDSLQYNLNTGHSCKDWYTNGHMCMYVICYGIYGDKKMPSGTCPLAHVGTCLGIF
jgi:hypothetical protein